MEYTKDEISKLAQFPTIKMSEIKYWDKIPFIILEEAEFIKMCLVSQIALLYRGNCNGCNFFVFSQDSIIATNIYTDLDFAEFIQSKYHFKFENGDVYKIFQLLHIENVDEFNAFKTSPWGKAAFTNGLKWDNPAQVYNAAFSQYQDFKNSNTADPILYYEFQRSGFDSITQYIDFKQKGFESKEEYTFVEKVVPKLRSKLTKKIAQIQSDIEETQKNGKDEAIIHYNFNIIEKRVQFLLRFCARDASMQVDNILEDLILLTETANIPFNVAEFKEWRHIRNTIVHDNAKIDSKQSKIGQQFFSKIHRVLDSLDDLLQKNALQIVFEETEDLGDPAMDDDEYFYDDS